jgi:hypothetical protein
VDSKNLSPGSRKSTYSRMWSVKFPGRQRRTTVSEIPTHENNHHRDLDIQDSNEFFKNYDNFLNTSPTATTSLSDNDDTLSPTNGLDRPRQLSTITESQNSTTSTPADSRRNSSLHYPKVDRIFEGVLPINLNTSIRPSASNVSLKSGIFNGRYESGNGDSECPYYPLGSETSTRPFTPRFTVEEVVSNNYEPVLFGKPRPAHLDSPVIVGPSPRLPKRQARMALRALNLSSATLKDDSEATLKREALKAIEQKNQVNLKSII